MGAVEPTLGRGSISAVTGIDRFTSNQKMSVCAVCILFFSEVRPAPGTRPRADWVIPAHVRPRDRDDAFRSEPTFTFDVRRRGATAMPNDTGRETLGRRGGALVRPVRTMTRSSTNG